MSRRKIDSPYNDRTRNNSPATPPSSTRFTIEQKVSGSKRGLQNIKRSVDPREVVIQRRFGEGSKPLFSREDVRVNTVSSRSVTPKKQRSRKERSSSNSSSEEVRQTVHTTRREKSQSPKRKHTPEKIPYFIDSRREEDRLRAKYRRSRRRSRSKSRRRTRTRSRSKSRSRRRSRSRSYSRRRYRTRSRSRSHSRTRCRSCSRHRSTSRGRSRRSTTRERSPYPEQRYIPLAIPVEYPCPAGWMAPQIAPYPRNPFLMRPAFPPPIPFYPVRQPFIPMEYPRRPMRFPGRHIRSYRPGPK